MDADQLNKIKNGKGFIAALDQSGGSTPKALALYGVNEDEYSNDEEMFTKVHEMRTRIITSPAFTGERIVAAILFENTLERQIEGQGTAGYLWSVKNIVPILKVDKGLDEQADDSQMMKPIPDLAATLDKAKLAGVFGTKMRSVIHEANSASVAAVVNQQFEIGKQIFEAGLVPIIEPEINIHSESKAEAEKQLKAEILKHLDALDANTSVMLKLTLPETANFYAELVDHPRVLKVVALSGGYSRDDANAKLAQNQGVIASFSRALTQGLNAQQSDEEFNAMLDETIQSIYEASIA